MGEYFVTCARMKELEKLSDENGLSYYQMMENAGTCAFTTIMERAQAKAGQRVVVFCGKGNNGGDGFVVARKLCETGLIVTVVLVDGRPQTTDAITNYELFKGMPAQIVDMTEGAGVAVALLKDSEVSPDIVVDAIYGTGFHGNLRPNASTATAYISRYRDRAYALDVPSGLAGDMKDGDPIDEGSAKVCTTITFHAKKPVHLATSAKEYCGEVVTVNIGITEE